MGLNSVRVAVIVGTRPNFIKAAAFFNEAKKHPAFEFLFIHTGQHFDDNMSKIFFDQMQLPRPDINLEIKDGMFGTRTGAMVTSLTNIFIDSVVDWVVVFGDVDSTLAGALAAVKAHCRLIHIEAGLRSHDRRMPEEVNRVIVDQLSNILFTSEPIGDENLAKEGVDGSLVHCVGSLMIESLELFKDEIDKSQATNNLEKKGYVVATIHRQENTDNPEFLKSILIILDAVCDIRPVVFPVHPRTMTRIRDLGLHSYTKRLLLLGPQTYFDFMKLVKDSKGVITDSGGIQEETSYLGIPCCTLRQNTERPITLTVGTNKLFDVGGPNPVPDIVTHLSRTFCPQPIYFWNKDVSSRIFTVLNRKLGVVSL